MAGKSLGKCEGCLDGLDGNHCHGDVSWCDCGCRMGYFGESAE